MNTGLKTPQFEECSCAFGLVDPTPPSKNLPLYVARLGQWRAGVLDFCDCKQGQSYMKLLARLDGSYETDSEQRERMTQAAKQAYQEKLSKDSGVPPKYAEFTLNGYVKATNGDADKKPVVDAIMQHYNTGQVDGHKGLFLWGPSGVGKTGALTPLYSLYLSRFSTGIWVNYHDLMARLKQFKEGNPEQFMKQLKEVDYLFVDDLFDASADKMSSDYERSQLFRIIEHRNTYSKPMFFTSNVDLEKISDEAHQRLARRISESCAVIRVGGKQL